MNDIQEITQKSRRLFVRGFSLQVLSVLSERPRSLLSILVLKKHLQRASTRGLSFTVCLLLYKTLSTQPALPLPLRKFTASLIPGLFVSSSVAAFWLVSSVYYRWLTRYPVLYIWWIFAAAMNYQLWAQAHHMPSAWTTAIAKGCGMKDFSCGLHRSRTREILPCSHPTLGMHPNNPSCLSAAARSFVSSFQGSSLLYLSVYLLKLFTSRFRQLRTRHSSLTFLLEWFRSSLMLTLQIQGGRAAFCIQSRLFPDRFVPWLGPLAGLIASNGILLETPKNRPALLLFNAANVVTTLMRRFSLDRRIYIASLFALAATLDRGESMF